LPVGIIIMMNWIKRLITAFLEKWFEDHPIFEEETKEVLPEDPLSYCIQKFNEFAEFKNNDPDSAEPDIFKIQLFGAEFRNDLGLWRDDSLLRHWFIDTYGISHPDDIYSVIDTLSGRRAQGLPDNVEELKARFDAHWEQYGFSSEDFDPRK
jgi:hypothetical protein